MKKSIAISNKIFKEALNIIPLGSQTYSKGVKAFGAEFVLNIYIEVKAVKFGMLMAISILIMLWVTNH